MRFSPCQMGLLEAASNRSADLMLKKLKSQLTSPEPYQGVEVDRHHKLFTCSDLYNLHRGGYLPISF